MAIKKEDVKAKETEDEKSKDKTEETEKDSEGTDAEEEVEETEEEQPAEDVATLKAQLAKVQAREKKTRDEAIKRRTENKTLKEEKARQDKALAILQGKKEPELDPVEKAQTEAKLKMSRAILRSELSARAKDAHDPKMLLQVAPEKFKDIEVDVDAETVDEEALDAALEDLRKSKPFLFQVKGEEDATPGKKGVKPPPPGTVIKGTNHFAQWKQLRTQGRHREAEEFHKKHHKEIKAQIQANPSLV